MSESPFILAKWAVRLGAVAFFGVDGMAIEAAAEGAASVAKDLWEKYLSRRTPQERCQDIEALAQAEAAEVVEALREELQAIPDAAARRAAEAYAAALPGQLRASLRSAADPSGRTVPPALVPQSAEDVLRLLPQRSPRFRAGDRPAGIGDWELVELLGTGGFGEVWKARNPHMSSHVAALKFCLDAKAAASLRREAALLNRVATLAQQASGIVRILGTAINAEPPCVIYELVEGGTLAALIRERQGMGQPFRAEEAARMILELAETMAVCHRAQPPIVHRDLKPANILVDARTGRLRIADFGIGDIAGEDLSAKPGGVSLAQRSLATASGSHTPLYASPQQMRGQPADVRDDVHALGVIWWQLLCADLTQGAPTGRWMQHLEKDGHASVLVELLADCMEASTERRVASAAALAVKLREAIEPKSQKAVVPSAAATSNAIPEKQRIALEEIIAAMVPIPPEQGAKATFAMCKYAVTQGWYEAVTGSNPSRYKGDAMRPVEQVNWHEAKAFCQQLNELCAKAGLHPGHRFALPTEAQWEQACRAGSKGDFGLLADGSEGTVDQMAWYYKNSGFTTHPVGQKLPNKWGLYDMHGNVWEWCEDTGRFMLIFSYRVIRGGSWANVATTCAAGQRLRYDPGNRNNHIGFRLASVPA